MKAGGGAWSLNQGAVEIPEGTIDFTLNCHVRGDPEPHVIIARG